MRRSLCHPFSLHSSRIGHCFRCFGGSNWSRHVPSISRSHFAVEHSPRKDFAMDYYGLDPHKL
ncbi:hypothetical protein OG21DRAFT_1254767 [Imleria badia]|nr:hypothetical protein OG21DRAFT_1254767 [Imleria badia]